MVLQEALASELAARMNAMNSASDNARDLAAANQRLANSKMNGNESDQTLVDTQMALNDAVQQVIPPEARSLRSLAGQPNRSPDSFS